MQLEFYNPAFFMFYTIPRPPFWLFCATWKNFRKPAIFPGKTWVFVCDFPKSVVY